jgi:quercetin dioxygenase-like cupin family protein
VLTILQGDGEVLGAEAPIAVRAGDVITCAPRELHGMRATDQQLVVMATISPRPGTAR